MVVAHQLCCELVIQVDVLMRLSLSLCGWMGGVLFQGTAIYKAAAGLGFKRWWLLVSCAANW